MTSIDAWEHTDTQITEILQVIDTHRGPLVDDRAEYGKLAKLLLRRAAVHEAAVRDVVRVVADRPEVNEIVEKIESDGSARRTILDRMERKSRGVQGINLNQGSDFDGDLMSYAALVRAQMPWERQVALPTMRTAVRGLENRLHGESYIVHHAPLRFGSRQWRGAHRAIASWLLTVSNHLGDFPWWNKHDPPHEVDLSMATRIVEWWRRDSGVHVAHDGAAASGDPTDHRHESVDRGSSKLVAAAGELDILTLLLNDHRQLSSLFDAYDRLLATERGEHLRVLVPVLVSHEMAEEEIVYPAIRSVDPEARATVRYRIQEQSLVEQMLKELEAMEPVSDEFDKLFKRMRLAVSIHMEQEESTVLPLIERYSDRLDRPTMGSRYRTTRSAAPTHPHPSAPHAPPGSTLTSPVMAAVDRFRDSLARTR